jgi:hypothetical protein
VDVAGAKRAAFQIAELVEHEQRMIAGTGEVPVVGRTLLLTVGGADTRIHVKNNHARRLAAMNPVDPSTGEIGEHGEVLIIRKPLRLEAAHLARRGRITHDSLAPDDPAHRRIAAEPVGIVDILIPGEATEHRLP